MMGNSTCRMKRVAAPLLFLVVMPAFVYAQAPRSRASLEEKANAALGLRASRIVKLAVPAVPDGPMNVRIPFDQSEITLNLYVHSIRAPGYQLLAQLDDGSIIEVDPGPVRTLRGSIAGEPGSHVAASLLEDGLHANITRADGRRFWIEPLSRTLPEAASADHVIYDAKDVLPNGGTCGMPEMMLADHRVAELLAEPLIAKSASGIPCIAELACDADVEFYIDQGSSVPAVEAWINTIINNVNVQYERDVDLTHQITTIIVRTGNRNSDPYSTNNPSGLLCQFITEWTNNQTAIPRDVAQFFTGRTLQANIIGIAADIGDACNSNGSCTCHPLFGSDGSYCLVQNIGGGDACRSDLSAHELGHLWGAIHCACTSPNFTMNPGITCANIFSAQSQFSINTFKSAQTCLDGPCAGASITNDVCEGAIDIIETNINFSTIGVGTECPALPAACDEGPGLTFLWDVWYRYTASCTGDATISLCGSDFDTRLIVYDDMGCPPLDIDLVACDDDFCGLGTGSQVTFPVVMGASYLVRVGGFGDLGQVAMSVACSGIFPCPADTNSDTLVNVTDLLQLLAAWGTCPDPCPPDINTDGSVNVTDLLTLLAAWGPCV